MTKILVEISGGVVDNVLCTDKDADLLVLDHDIDGADEEELEAYHNLLDFSEKFRPGLHPVY